MSLRGRGVGVTLVLLAEPVAALVLGLRRGVGGAAQARPSERRRSSLLACRCSAGLAGAGAAHGRRPLPGRPAGAGRVDPRPRPRDGRPRPGRGVSHPCGEHRACPGPSRPGAQPAAGPRQVRPRHAEAGPGRSRIGLAPRHPRRLRQPRDRAGAVPDRRRRRGQLRPRPVRARRVRHDAASAGRNSPSARPGRPRRPSARR